MERNYFSNLYKVLITIEYASCHDLDVDDLIEKLNINENELDIVIFNILNEKLVINRLPVIFKGSSKGINPNKLHNPQLTTAGYQFLEENTQIKKICKFFKEIKDIIPGL